MSDELEGELPDEGELSEEELIRQAEEMLARAAAAATPPGRRPSNAQGQEHKAIDLMFRISQARLAGYYNQRLIAQLLKVSPATVNKYMKRLDALLLERAAEGESSARGLDLMRLDELLQAVSRKALKGDLHAVDRFLEILRARARLLGLYREKLELGGELDVRATHGLDEEAARRLGDLIVQGAKLSAFGPEAEEPASSEEGGQEEASGD